MDANRAAARKTLDGGSAWWTEDAEWTIQLTLINVNDQVAGQDRFLRPYSDAYRFDLE